MSYTVAAGTFESLRDSWKKLLPLSATNTLFVTPRWQELWWKHFSAGKEALMLAVYHNDQLVGIAPLMTEGSSIAIIGSTEVCDYRDIVVMEEHCSGTIAALLAFMGKRSLSTFVLHSVPGMSPTLAHLRHLAESHDYGITIEQEDVCPQVDLPADWDRYLAGLSKKDRHELRRKFRRLTDAGQVRMYASQDAGEAEQHLEEFFRLMRDSREEKATFMTPENEAFFREAMLALMPRDIARLFFLEIDGINAASVICFDYDNQRLLYNSGFDHRYAHLSVGLLLKAYALRDAIETGMRRFDFLRGDEPYKYDLGGVDYPIYQCTIQRC